MLFFANRLKKKKDFEKVFEQGKGFKENSLYLKIKENNLEQPRFGFAVGKKFSVKAVERNKIKRKLREVVKKEIPNFKKKVDAVIVVMPGLKEKEIEKTIKKLFLRAKLLND